MKNFKIVFVVLLSSLILMMSGCGKSKNVTITLWERMEPEMQQVFDELAAEFMDQNPNITIVRKHDTLQDIADNLEQAISQRQAPDLIYFDSNYVGMLEDRNLIEPVTDFVSQDFLNRFSDSTLENGNIDGIQYSVPVVIQNMLVLVYNKAYIQTPPEAWDELVTTALSRRSNTEDAENAVYGFLAPETYYFWLMSIYNAYGGKVFDENSNLILDTEIMTQALEFAKSITENYGVGFSGMQSDDFFTKFLTNKAAMIIVNSSIVPKLIGSDIDYAVFQLPLLPNGTRITSFFSTSGYSIIKGTSQNKKESIEQFLEFMLSPDNNAKMAAASMQVPAGTAAAETDMIINNEYISSLLPSVESSVPLPCNIEQRAVWNTISSELEKVLYENKAPVDAAEAMKEQIEEQIERMHND